MTYLLKDVIPLIEGDFEVWGDESKFTFKNVRTLEEADSESIVWIRNDKKNKEALLENTEASFVICGMQAFPQGFPGKLLLKVNDPKLIYARVVSHFFTPKREAQIHPSAVIDRDAILGDNVSIGAFCVIGKVTVGDGTSIAPHCTINDDCIIGQNVYIGAGTVVGGPGFGFATNAQGQHERFPHIGNVIIEDDVEIGANTCIDKGTLGSTVLKRGCKVDNLVHIAHNVVLGERSFVVANAMVAGSCTIGENTWVAPSSSIRDTVSVGRNALIGMGSVVTKSVPDKEVWTGVPAKKIR